MLYPTYTVNTFPMQDPQGRWHEHERMRVLPAHPGLRITSIQNFGMGGESILPQAPHLGGEFILHMVVNAINPTTGQRGATLSERLVQLHDNATALFQALNTARQSQGTPAVLERHLSAYRYLTAHAYLSGTSEPEYDPGRDYAEYQFIFRIPSSLWRGYDFDERVDGIGTHWISQLAGSTAIIDGPVVVAVGPWDSLQVTNAAGNGFHLSQSVTAGQAIAINTASWGISAPYTLDPENPLPEGTTYSYGAALRSLGATSGVALSLLPERDGASVTVNGTGWGEGSAVYIHTSEAYF